MKGLPDSIITIVTIRDSFGNIVWSDSDCFVPKVKVIVKK